MELQVIDGQGKASGELTVADEVFDRPFNEGLIHQLVVAYLANGRSDTVGQKNRAAVRGGGRKPWRQKGTGRARAGTIRSPLWRGGGKTFTANDRHHRQKINRRAYQVGMCSIVSELLRQDRLRVVQDLRVSAPKTRELVGLLTALGVERALLVVEQVESNLALAARNLPHVDVVDAAGVDPVRLIASEQVVITTGALAALQGRLS